jgi:hypothetical protein
LGSRRDLHAIGRTNRSDLVLFGENDLIFGDFAGLAIEKAACANGDELRRLRV